MKLLALTSKYYSHVAYLVTNNIWLSERNMMHIQRY